MAESEGEITYQQFTIVLQRRLAARFITARDHGVSKTKWRKFMYNHATTANPNITYVISDHHVEKKILYKMKD